MPIRFACEKCGHPFEVDDRFAGKLGHCKHCGHVAPIPGALAITPAPAAGLTLRPLEGEASRESDDAEHLPAGLQIWSVPPEDVPSALGHDADEPEPEPAHEAPARRGRFRSRGAKPKGPYEVLDPDDREGAQARAFYLNPHYETRLARFASRNLRQVRDWLYVISLAFLALAAVALAASNRPLLHLGAAGVVACNIGMLVTAVFYLVTLPFKDSLAAGLGTLLLPPFAVYYWVTHWPKMRKSVVNTLRSFTPIALVGLAYVLYEEAPTIRHGVERAEQALEKQGEAIERLTDPAETPPAERPAPEARAPEKDTPAPRTGRPGKNGTVPF